MRSTAYLKLLKISVGGFLVCACSYVAAWMVAYFYIDRIAQTYFFEREGQVGRKWSCSQRQTSGDVISLTYRCLDANVQVQSKDGELQATAPALTLTYSLSRPNSLRVDIASPARILLASKDTQLETSWKTFVLDGSTRLTAGSAVSLDITDMQARVIQNSSDSQFRFASLKASLNWIPDEIAAAKKLLFNIDIAGLWVEPVDRAFSDVANADFNASGTVTRAEQLVMRSNLAERLGRWRESGGMLAVSRFVLTRSRLRIEAEGNVTLDAMRRPAGHISGRAAGYSSLLQMFGMSDRIAKPSGLLGGLLGGRKGTETSINPNLPDRLIPFAFSIRDGALWLGPLKIPVAIKPLI